MSKKVTTVVKKVKDTDEVRQMALDWFERMNKPVTPQALTDALGSRVSKALLQKTMDELVSENKLIFKDLKKVRFYFLNLPPEGEEEGGEKDLPAAADSPPCDDDNDDDEEKRKREELVNDILILTESVRVLEGLNEQLSKRPTLADRQEGVNVLTREVEEMESEIADLAAAATESTSTTRKNKNLSAEETLAAYHLLRSLWKERKEMTNRLVDSTFDEAYSMPELCELFGLVLDEEAGVSLQSTAVALPSSLH
ncbi:26S proteasome regulatory subunit, ATPase 3, interacting protein [Angomonas deanei]|nr:26S proteasome regulatory subunit, ATPase 3, interacting protein [Angomonas deanei]|eukprot:EPY25060.1 26S proteasome regulatory subunit, ATPase 3, interacting protein [Angomonas deanei]